MPTLRNFLLRLFWATDMLGPRLVLLVMGIQWSCILLGGVSIPANQWGWDLRWWGVGWLVYSVVSAMQIARPTLVNDWELIALNVLGFVLTSMWAFSVIQNGTYPVPAMTVTIVAFWILVRTRRSGGQGRRRDD